MTTHSDEADASWPGLLLGFELSSRLQLFGHVLVQVVIPRHVILLKDHATLVIHVLVCVVKDHATLVIHVLVQVFVPRHAAEGK